MNKDNTDLIAAALGLRSSTWAQAVVHITDPKFNAAINGEQVIKDGKTMEASKALMVRRAAVSRFGLNSIPYAYGRGFRAAQRGILREKNPYVCFRDRHDVNQEMVARMERQWFDGWDDYKAAS